MADDADEDVVFANSALHQHLEDVGFEEMELEHHASRVENVGDGATTLDPPPKEVPPRPPPSPKVKLRQWWQQEGQRVEHCYGISFGKEVLKAGVLEEEDSHFLHNYLHFLNTQQPDHGDWINSANAVKVILGISGVLCAYGAHRWLGTGLLPMGIFPVWLYDITMVTLGLVSLLPFLTCLLMQLAHKLWVFTSANRLKSLLEEVRKHQNICKKALRLIQETELVARGFTLVNSNAPISRLEQSGPRMSERQCPELRRLLFHACRDVMLTTRNTMQNLVARCPLIGPGGENGSYLAQISLEEYGPCLTLTDEEELCKATDNYSIAALKAIFHVSCLHQSELLRRFVVGCLLQAKNSNISVLSESKKIVHDLVITLKKSLTSLTQIYEVHQCAMLDPLEGPEVTSRVKGQGQIASVYTALHSLDLHFQAALRRVKELENRLEPYCGSLEPLTPESKKELTYSLKVIRADLNSCKDCWEESVARVEKGGEPPTPTHSKSSGSSDIQEDDNQLNEPIAIFDLGDPIIQDQVFEAYTDPTEVDPTDWDMEPLLSEEERVKRRHEKQEAVRLLKELKSVIAVRGQQWEEREKRARLLMQTDGAEDICDSSATPTDESVTTSTTETEDNETRVTTSSNSDIDIEEICQSIIAPSEDPEDQTRTLLHIEKEECDKNASSQPPKDSIDTSEQSTKESQASPSKAKRKSHRESPEKDFGYFLDESDMSPEGELISRYEIQAAFAKRTLEEKQAAENESNGNSQMDSVGGSDSSNGNSHRLPSTAAQPDRILVESQDNVSNSPEHSRTNRDTGPEEVDNKDSSSGSLPSSPALKKSPSDKENDDSTTEDTASSSQTDNLAAFKEKLAQTAPNPLLVTQSNMAAMAALKSQSFGLQAEETFGDSDSDDDGVIEG